jgi:hypothetical protein
VQNLDGTQVTGLVTALDNSGTTPALVINGTSYSLSSVKRIEAAATTAATGTTGSTSTGTTGATTPTAAEATPNPPDVAQTPTPSTTTVPSLKG